MLIAEQTEAVRPPQEFSDPGLEALVLAALARAGAGKFFEISGILSHKLFLFHRADYLALSQAFCLGRPLPPVPDVDLPPGFDLEEAAKKLADLAVSRILAEAVSRAQAEIGKKPIEEVIARLRWAIEEASGEGPKIRCMADPDFVNETLAMVQNGILARKALARYVSLVPAVIAAALDRKELALEVFAVLCYLWDQQGRQENGMVRTTRAEMCRMLDMRRLPSTPRQIDEALAAMCRTFIDSEGPIVGTENGKPVERRNLKFRLIASVARTAVRDGKDVPTWKQELVIHVNPLALGMLKFREFNPEASGFSQGRFTDKPPGKDREECLR